jgi:hypothetical protein
MGSLRNAGRGARFAYFVSCEASNLTSPNGEAQAVANAIRRVIYDGF